MIPLLDGLRLPSPYMACEDWAELTLKSDILSGIVIMDNATCHKSSGINQLIEAKHCVLLYLPRYSPERNWVEKYWSILRKKVKQIQCTPSDIYDAISEG